MFATNVAESDIPWQAFLVNGTAVFNWVNGQRLKRSTLEYSAHVMLTCRYPSDCLQGGVKFSLTCRGCPLLTGVEPEVPTGNPWFQTPAGGVSIWVGRELELARFGTLTRHSVQGVQALNPLCLPSLLFRTMTPRHLIQRALSRCGRWWTQINNVNYSCRQLCAR